MNGLCIVALGASGGGLQALKDFFYHIPANTSAAFVVLTHVKRDHRSRLAEMISQTAKLPVIRVIKPTELLAGTIYVLPENIFLEINNSVLVTRERRPDEIINRAVDIFFKSLAKDAGRRAIGIILSGAGSDGLEGAKAIESAGGLVMAQSTDDSEFSQMPMAVIENDHPRFIGNVFELAVALIDHLSKVKSYS